MQYNTHMGVYYYSPGLFAGLSAHHFIPVRNGLQPSSRVKPDFIIHGGYLFRSLGDPKLEISANARFLDYSTLEYDLHIRTYIQDYHWLAISYRSYHALAMHLGIKVSAIHLAYTFEANLSNMVRYHMGTHAIHLGLNLGMRRTEGF
jgi:hypothetical protein